MDGVIGRKEMYFGPISGMPRIYICQLDSNFAIFIFGDMSKKHVTTPAVDSLRVEPRFIEDDRLKTTQGKEISTDYTETPSSMSLTWDNIFQCQGESSFVAYAIWFSVIHTSTNFWETVFFFLQTLTSSEKTVSRKEKNTQLLHITRNTIYQGSDGYKQVPGAFLNRSWLLRTSQEMLTNGTWPPHHLGQRTCAPSMFPVWSLFSKNCSSVAPLQ